MASSELAAGLVFLLQTGVGILGNVSLLYLYIFAFSTKHSQRPTDFILSHLMLANFLVLSSKGIHHTMAAFDLQYFLGDVECKLSFYIHRVARGVSLCTTCLLSVFQALTINPRNSRWTKFKLKALKCVQPPCYICWILHFLVNTIVPLRVISPKNTTNSTINDFGLCSTGRSNSFVRSLYAVLFSFLDILCLGLMAWASGSIVVLLQKHKQQVQYIRTGSPGASPETSAAHTVLLLASSFLSFYLLSSSLTLYMTYFGSSSRQLMNITTFLAACFPTLSPYVLIHCDARIYTNYLASGKTKTSH
ncbi:vomeronasal type-1 receptor 4-like [Lepus europaeus]|uniref:vomeronasal type-1 receptor 4-like n=1 Tax=Lepus europaeus TaxID=9983 RepID=UPI002B46795C|nr:vomeronasal type-1 receptor 4-like [Lepus europaeus]